MIYRKSKHIDEAVLVLGTLQKVNNPKGDMQLQYEEKGLDVKIYKGTTNIHLAIMESLKESCALMIKDDYEPWGAHKKNTIYGKPLIVDQTDYETLQIFFDDNNTGDDKNIVDVRDLITGKSLPIGESKAAPNQPFLSRYLVQVDIIGAILKKLYFYNIIMECERLRQEEIELIEGGGEVVEEEVKISKYEELKNAPDDEYLRQTLLPVLYPALELVDMERPNDPVSFLAYYLLKHKDQIKLPKKPGKGGEVGEEGEEGQEEEAGDD